MTTDLKLPELPAPRDRALWSGQFVYGPEQMHARDRQIVELCARVCEQLTVGDMPGPALGRSIRCAGYIRALLLPKEDHHGQV